MDDHVHVLVQPLGDFALGDILHSWKSYTGSLLQKGRGRKGSIWQDEYFDRIVRPTGAGRLCHRPECLEKAQYILNNPQKRWPQVEDYPWVGVSVREWARGWGRTGRDACPTGCVR